MNIEQKLTSDKNITNKKPRKEYKKDNEIDWDSIQFEYENIKISDVKLAEKYETYNVNIKRKAIENGWVKFKKQINTELAKPIIPAHTEQILNTVAMRKIKEIREELGIHYSTVDEALIVMYGKTYQRYLELETIVDEEKYVSYGEKGGAYLNPHYSALLATIKNLVNIGDKLGLSMESRKKLGILLGGGDDKAKGLFGMLEDFAKQNSLEIKI